MVAALVDAAVEWSEFDSRLVLRAVALLRKLLRPFLNVVIPLRRFDDTIYQAPLLGALPLNAFGNRAEDIGQIPAHPALIGHACKASRSGKHSEQRNFGQAHCGRAIIDEDDLVAGESQFVSSSCRRAVARGQELHTRAVARVLNPITGLVRELAEVYLPGMRRAAQHIDICARAEDPLLGAGEHYRPNFRMFKTNTLQRVVQFDVDAKIIGV